jgi:hypothetical protein
LYDIDLPGGGLLAMAEMAVGAGDAPQAWSRDWASRLAGSGLGSALSLLAAGDEPTAINAKTLCKATKSPLAQVFGACVQRVSPGLSTAFGDKYRS